MVASVLESTPSTIATTLASSLLPKLGLVFSLPTFSTARSPSSSSSFNGVFAAAAKQKKKATSARDWSYEHLMVVWDEVFERCCSEPAKATHIRDVSRRGLAEHGRGCVLVYESIKTKPRGKGTGFTSKPPRSSLDVPEFVVLEWNAVYVPREFLLDPRKAPDEDVRPLDATAVDISLVEEDSAASSSTAPVEEVEDGEPVDTVAHPIEPFPNPEIPAFVEDVKHTEHCDDANDTDFVLIDSPASHLNKPPADSKTLDETGNVRPHNAVALDVSMNEDDLFIDEDNLAEGIQLIEAEWDRDSVGNEDGGVQLVNQHMLISALRGVGVTRLVSLTANFDSEYGDFRSPTRGAVVDTRTMDAGGEDPYNPTNEEVVLMLHLFVDGKPAVGADVVVAYEDELNIGDSEDKAMFKWRLKYSI